MRGINLEGFVDGRLGERHLDIVRAAGFDTVRLPVKWSLDVFARVDRAIAATLDRDLDVVLTVHHFDEPDRDASVLLALWDRIARRYADADPRLAFELLNEPHPPLTAARWNALLVEVLAVVRASNPRRTAIAGPVLWNTVDGLPELELPADDRLVATVHYYSPFAFTHQGAAWLPEARDWCDVSWGSDADRARVRGDLEGAAAWAQARGVPLFLGEFGVVEHAHMAARADWTRTVRTEAERLGLDWCYWDFATDFGAYDLERDAWRAPLLDALLGDVENRPAAPTSL
jgi:endoglucanase